MSPYCDVHLETDRLVLRAWTLDDTEAAFEMYGDPEVVLYIGNQLVESVEAQRDMLDRVIQAYVRLDLGMGSFPIVERATGVVVGAGLLKPLPRTEDLDSWRALRDDPEDAPLPEVHEVEVGWHLAKRHWGNGYATEAAARLIQYGREELRLPEIYAVLFRENTRSAKVAERLGMRHLGSTDRFYGHTVEEYVTP